MLADNMLQLLTAYVDGELGPRQRQAVLRLLYQSSEAREVLRQLQENLHKVQQLPRKKLDPAFVNDVLSAIAERQVTPARPVTRPAPAVLRWVPLALVGMAAAMLFVVALGGVLYVALNFGANEQVVLNPPAENKVPNANVDTAPGRTEPPIADNSEQKKPTPVPRPLDPMIGRVIVGAVQQYGTHMAPDRGFAFRDLTKEPVGKQVAAELRKNNALDLEITARSNQQALERLKRVLKNNKIELVTDPATIAALNQTAGKMELLVYADNLRADEVAKILKELAVDEKKAANPFDTVTVASLSPHDRQQVNDRLGNELKIRDDASQKKGLLPKAKQGPPAKMPTRVVAVLPPEPQSKVSDPMRQFLLQPADPGTLRVLVRIRQK